MLQVKGHGSAGLMQMQSNSARAIVRQGTVLFYNMCYFNIRLHILISCNRCFLNFRTATKMAFTERGFVVREVLPHIIDCTRELYRDESKSTDQWLFITNEALYYILPIILTVGIIFSIINTIVSAKMCVDSHECYLTAFNLSCCLLLVTSCISQLPNYVRQSSSEYKMLLPYLPAVENWLWYSCTWLLITIVIERAAHSLCGKWHASFGRIHGVLVAFLIMIISFVSTLPQYWEYELSEINDNHGDHNCSRSVLVPRADVLQEDGKTYIVEYTWFHWYEMIVSIGLPYLLLPMILSPLVCVKMHIYTSLPTTSSKNGGSMKYNSGSSTKDQLRQERSFNRLIFTISILYLTMAGPRNALRLFENPPISKEISDNDLLVDTLQVLFEALFYLFFSLLFFLYLAFGVKFRITLYQLCCCKKQDPIDYY